VRRSEESQRRADNVSVEEESSTSFYLRKLRTSSVTAAIILTPYTNPFSRSAFAHRRTNRGGRITPVAPSDHYGVGCTLSFHKEEGGKGGTTT